MVELLSLDFRRRFYSSNRCRTDRLYVQHLSCRLCDGKVARLCDVSHHHLALWLDHNLWESGLAQARVPGGNLDCAWGGSSGDCLRCYATSERSKL